MVGFATRNASGEREVVDVATQQDVADQLAALASPFEKLVIWAEESSTISGNQQEWSFGNGASGQIGITLPEDWYLYALTTHFDVFPSGRVVTLTARNQATAQDIPGAQIVTTGPTNNAQAVNLLPTPILLPAGTVLGFRTVSVTGGGGVSDGRIAAWLRR